MTNDEALGAVFMQFANIYILCDQHPVTLTFRPFDPLKGCVRKQLRCAFAKWVEQIPPFFERHGHKLDMSDLDLLAFGFMRYPALVDAVTPQPTATVVVFKPGKPFKTEVFMDLMNNHKAELLRKCPKIAGQFADYAFGCDGSVEAILASPFRSGQVSPADIIFSTQETAFDWYSK
ncbi:hypothetical protein G3545_13690 [Starkeya sp. ORNL1]|uniref:hypothetical protein n=1 Tax=Starkeya sp. ORNL1 TaxID=2709380 RepID=UPI001462A3C7|nr:hypothetical protein [Starkeya sp. ORNL1]QJP14604.1 hypothetical protein G3545_13690 [Starkeya sp. ORNL1]